MKRRKPISSPPSPISTPPSTPPTPQPLDNPLLSKTPQAQSLSSKRPKRSLSQTLKVQILPPPSQTEKWVPLNLGKSELSLPLTFPTGQTFRWKKTRPLQYTGVVKSHLVSLKHLENGDVGYCFHDCSNEDVGRLDLLDFLNVGICLADMWEGFAASDQRFAELAPYLAGARVLRQDPLECLIQFLCSSNNNIGRITRMVDYISSMGDYLGTVEGFDFHEFPSLERLAMVSEEELREAGFGYRLIATRYLLPELAGVRLTSKLCKCVAEAFVARYGKYAGWAQTLLFVAELPSQKALISSQSCTVKEKKNPVRKESPRVKYSTADRSYAYPNHTRNDQTGSKEHTASTSKDFIVPGHGSSLKTSLDRGMVHLLFPSQTCCCILEEERGKTENIYESDETKSLSFLIIVLLASSCKSKKGFGHLLKVLDPERSVTFPWQHPSVEHSVGVLR
ncbi:hypothetical protein Cgig2_012012 [Carnegiea gigantea]|uniref:8-oxoguanine DNA glycosylase N-terminal domain-containing protein n=1 Tax=Carnegiea gigantea TaxID=171969 RepID=A0A9Q1KR52_9CARY|nr:hypothetical protein Cgig2_012012 [Carnegiea gigantea]